MKLEFDGTDVIYRHVEIIPWIYEDRIVYSLNDQTTGKNICGGCESVGDAINLIDKHRMLSKNNGNFIKFAKTLKLKYDKAVYTDFGDFKQIFLQHENFNLMAISEHSKDLPQSVLNQTNGAIVIMHKPGPFYWNNNANKVFEFPSNIDEYNVIIEYIEQLSKVKKNGKSSKISKSN